MDELRKGAWTAEVRREYLQFVRPGTVSDAWAALG